MSDYNLGTARGRIEIDASGAEKGAKKAGKAVDGFSGKAAKAGPGLVAAGGAVGTFGAVVAGGFALAVNSASDFEKRLSAIQAVSGATQGEMQSLADKALQLGADTAFSASEAAVAIEELVKAGVTVPDVLNGAADAVVALAAAGEIALPEAATIAANAMNSFNLQAKDMPKVADLIAGAANASAIGVGEFGQSMQQASAVANLAGFSFEDTAIAIAEMGNAGIKGSDAGTSLKSMLMNLQPTTDKAKAAMEDLGLWSEKTGSAFYDAEGNTKSLKDIQDLLAKSTKNLSNEQKQAALEAIFGSDAIRAASVFANEGAKGYDNLSKAMSGMTAADVAATRMDNLAGSWEQLKGSLETLAITVGQYITPVLKTLADQLTNLVNWFMSLDEGTRQTILIIVAILGVLSVVIGVVLAVAGAIGMLLGALAPLAAVIGVTAGVLAGWIVVIIAIIAIVVVLAVLIWKNWDKIKAWTINAWNAIKDWVVNAWNTIYDAVAGFLSDIWSSIKEYLSGIYNFWRGIWDSIWGAVETVWGWIVAYITFYINIIKTVIQTVLNFIIGIWTAIWGVFGPVVMSVWNFILAVIRLGTKLIHYVISAFLAGVQVIWNWIWKNIVERVIFWWNVIKLAVSLAVNFVKAKVQAVMNAVRGFLQAVWSRIAGIANTVWAKIRQYIIDPIVNAYNRVAAVVKNIYDKVAEKFNAVKAKVVEIWNGVKNAIKEKIDAVLADVRAVVDKVKGVFSGAKDWLLQAGRNIIQGLIDGITGMIDSLTSKLNFITDLIPDEKGPERVDKKLLYRNGQWIMGGLREGLEDEWSSVARGLNQMTAQFPDLAVTQSVTAAPARVAAAALATPASSAVSPEMQPRETGELRVVNGRFTIDKNGVAWFQGLAQEVVDNDKTLAGTTGRMGGF